MAIFTLNLLSFTITSAILRTTGGLKLAVVSWIKKFFIDELRFNPSRSYKWSPFLIHISELYEIRDCGKNALRNARNVRPRTDKYCRHSGLMNGSFAIFPSCQNLVLGERSNFCNPLTHFFHSTYYQILRHGTMSIQIRISISLSLSRSPSFINYF